MSMDPDYQPACTYCDDHGCEECHPWLDRDWYDDDELTDEHDPDCPCYDAE